MNVDANVCLSAALFLRCVCRAVATRAARTRAASRIPQHGARQRRVSHGRTPRRHAWRDMRNAHRLTCTRAHRCTRMLPSILSSSFLACRCWHAWRRSISGILLALSRAAASRSFRATYLRASSSACRSTTRLFISSTWRSLIFNSISNENISGNVTRQ